METDFIKYVKDIDMVPEIYIDYAISGPEKIELYTNPNLSKDWNIYRKNNHLYIDGYLFPFFNDGLFLHDIESIKIIFYGTHEGNKYKKCIIYNRFGTDTDAILFNWKRETDILAETTFPCMSMQIDINLDKVGTGEKILKGWEPIKGEDLWNI